MNTKNLNITESALEYIEALSKKTITPITGWNIIDSNATLFFQNAELKQKADDHGTTELLSEMFFKYLKDNEYAEEELPTLTFKSNKSK